MAEISGTSSTNNDNTIWIQCLYELGDNRRFCVIYPKGEHNSHLKNCHVYEPAYDNGTAYWKLLSKTTTKRFNDALKDPKFGARLLSVNEWTPKK